MSSLFTHKDNRKVRKSDRREYLISKIGRITKTRQKGVKEEDDKLILENTKIKGEESIVNHKIFQYN